MAEICPVFDQIKDDLRTNLTFDLIEELSFTRFCFYESLRIAPPAPMSGTLTFLRDTKIKGIQFNAGMAFWLNFTGMHHWSTEWQRPAEFLPDRFDINSPLFSKPNGEKRNPLSFTPFLGGKRICLGKHFAENVVKTSLPLLLYHFDFSFSNRDQEI